MDVNTTLKKPDKSNSKEIFKIIKESKTLDLNSEYLYLLLSTHFKDSCSLAFIEGELASLVLAYYLPNEEETLFIWQIATKEKFRGKNLTLKLLEDIVSRKEINKLITTVSPDNIASRKIFEKFAKNNNSEIKKSILFSKDDFINSHEDEVLFTINLKGEKNENI
ncbi:diaminobutyrate acetyltransferase [Arcobacter porcinus]|uniref:L-2,4-diaminobutyric acid acetyltransferase n=1 Tax=Arcobacter porcinus TaxID=1935204 RepID=A0ABX2YBA9_9BACT|nr:diaminobutyrate acetyltransferase [Arcobacter porcinus]OCL84133.1 L-2,4-diaminobutyric acid acetyltransferase [Arcobacter porcinus]OCL89197.1 L-2,4-diaminobutyric acid acetyltransferase [Arcobacter porcinus]OCL91617.1 L-2,4-diaminobutyric acid acetyltransferase [Arcobacter porcinus]